MKADEMRQVFPAAFPWDGIWLGLIPVIVMVVASAVSGPSLALLAFPVLAGIVFVIVSSRSVVYELEGRSLSYGSMQGQDVRTIKCRKITIQSFKRRSLYQNGFVYIGEAVVNGTKSILYSTKSAGEVVQLEYKGCFFIVSPRDPDAFVRAIEAAQHSPI
jgi:hypothetical protein